MGRGDHLIKTRKEKNNNIPLEKVGIALTCQLNVAGGSLEDILK